MRIGVPKETAAGEHRVALVPEVLSKLTAKGLDVVVQSGAGEGALLPDELYTEAGASIGDAWSADRSPARGQAAARMPTRRLAVRWPRDVPV